MLYKYSMVATIQISDELLFFLKKRKAITKETYNEIILDVLESNLKLSEKTIKNINKARKEISNGKYITLSNLKEKYNIK